MIGYYLDLALRSCRRNKVLTALMVLAIALGIGAAMTTLIVFHVLSGNPMPGRSDTLFRVQVDPTPANGDAAEEPPDLLTRFDAESLLRAGRAERQALMAGGVVSVVPSQRAVAPFRTSARLTSADFFAMFDTPFLYGGGWNSAADENHARVAVLSRELNEQLFGGGNSVGRSLRLGDAEFRIVGVLDRWRPVPNFFDLSVGRFGEIDQVFMPYTTSRDLDIPLNGTMSCYAMRDDGQLDTDPGAPCMWLQFWVQLDDPAREAAYADFLRSYSEQQRAAGRFERAPNVRLRDVMDWLRYREVVPGDVQLQAWIAFGFLLVCLLNTIALLLAKFLQRSGEIGVRRALGASRRTIFAQHLVESGVIGIAGGMAGLALALLGLWAVRRQPGGYGELAHLDLPMLLTTFVLAIAASLLAGLLPAWRACQIAPAIQLKSQ